MSNHQVHIRCPDCGEFNSNPDECAFCGSMLDLVKRRALERAKYEEEVREKERLRAPDFGERLAEKMRTHPWLFIRVIYKIASAIYMVVMAIVMFIAWLISFLLA